MTKTVIKVEKLSKAYRLGQLNTGALSQDIERWWALFRGKEDPFLQIGETNDRTTKSKGNIVWSLKDLNFEIESGDAVGIVGKNGAGKSTLLKLLSRVTSPTKGSIKIKGRVASLLEVGTGFHPELTGRENVFLNGAILGMRKSEIKEQFDEIVDFSGVEKYVDTPVKRYSSGMRVRLGFAVAAHLRSEILIVDEVLAVGDAEFQRKCLGKMGELSKGEGRTVLFVSHNMNSVNRLCKKGIFLQQGMLEFSGEVGETINAYMNDYQENNKLRVSYKPEVEPQRGKSIQLLDLRLSSDDRIEDIIDVRSLIKLVIKVRLTRKINSPKITFHFKNKFDEFVWFADMKDNPETKVPHDEGEYEFEIIVPSPMLKPDSYNLSVGIVNEDNAETNHFPSVLRFELVDFQNARSTRAGYLYTESPWLNKSY